MVMAIKKTRIQKNNQPKKIYVLDTNVLLHDPLALFAFSGALIGIPVVVLEEIDQFKREGTDRGRNSREVIRQLDELRSRGSLGDGIELDNGGMVKVFFTPLISLPDIPLDLSVKDNQIILTALMLKRAGYQVRFISKDLNARVKADALGIPSEDYLKEFVSQEEFYKGWMVVQTPAIQLKKGFPDILLELAGDKVVTINEFVVVESRSNPFNNQVYRYLGGNNFKHVLDPQLRWPLKPRNTQQLMAMDLLLDQNVQLVTLFGPAGTGKTFLALLAGLQKVLVEDAYEKMLVSRPVVPLGKDIGYLPGDIQEKLHSWMMPIYDNMDYIVHTSLGGGGYSTRGGHQFEDEDDSGYRKKKKKFKKGSKKKDKPNALGSLDDLIYRGKVSLEAITYMRGRSIPYQYILIDEAQNLTPHEVKTIVTRAGVDSKIVLVGDPYQIDSPYLDFGSNGLVRTSERFKGHSLFGSVFLEISERSELSKLAGQLL
jgi:PhoH-like ATPase